MDDPRVSFLVNIDVNDLARAAAFYTQALGLTVGRRFEGVVKLLGGNAPIYLLERAAGTAAARGRERNYARHWTPVHLDFVVTGESQRPPAQGLAPPESAGGSGPSVGVSRSLAAAVERAVSAGAVVEQPIASHAWGELAVLADPFGNGFCLLWFNELGYDALSPQTSG